MSLSSRNSEAQQCANTNRASIENNRVGNIDMNSVQNSALTFHNTTFSYMEVAGQIWLTATEVGEALGYSDDKAIHRLYRKHADEFTVKMTGVVKVTTPGGLQDSRVFSLRGAHLMGMLSRTTVAKEFRRWVLDILDREVVQSPIAKQFTDAELCDLAWLWRAGDVMINACRSVTPLLEVAQHRQAGHFVSIGLEYERVLKKGRDVLNRETAHIKYEPWGDESWSRILPGLRKEVH